MVEEQSLKSFDSIVQVMKAHGVSELLIKRLAPNDNTKNQIYLGGDLSDLGKLPSGDLVLKPGSSNKLPTAKRGPIFHAALKLAWLTEDGRVAPAPNAKLIVYPQYPEVRMSGFIRGCTAAPAALFDASKFGRHPGRVLVMGVTPTGMVIAAAFLPEHPVARALASLTGEPYGALRIVDIADTGAADSEHRLLSELARIHNAGWIDSKRLSKAGIAVCKGSNCGGYTLEAELGIAANGLAEPDFHGWEVKQHGVKNFDRPRLSVVTLLTPEPSSGVYVSGGVEAFIRKWGYADTLGREDRLNFGGVYRCDKPAHARTGLRLVLDGFDAESKSIRGDGSLALIDASGEVAAAWDFAKLMDHWKRKHAKAVFVPSISQKVPMQKYRYGSRVMLAEGADFLRLLEGLASGAVYYDPGIKLEGASGPNAEAKRRSQFRISSAGLPSLYGRSRDVDVSALATGQGQGARP